MTDSPPTDNDAAAFLDTIAADAELSELIDAAMPTEAETAAILDAAMMTEAEVSTILGEAFAAPEITHEATPRPH